MARVIERVSGVASGLVGLLTLAWLLFGPDSRYVRGITTCTSVPIGVSCTSTGLDHITTGPIQIDVFPLAIALLSVVALLFVAIAISAVAHSRNRDTLWQAGLWASTGLLLILMLLTLTNLALALSPALALAGVASGAAWITARERAAHADGRGLARSMEAVGGVAAGVFGFAASVYLLVAPNQEMSESTECDAQGVCHAITTGSPSPLLADPVGTLFIGVVTLAFFGLLAYAAVRHSRTGEPLWRGWLWVVTVLLVLLSFLGALSIGSFFLPSAVLALFATIGSLSPARAPFEMGQAT